MHKDHNDFRILVVEDNPGDYLLIEEFLFEQIHAPRITHVTTFYDAKVILNDKFDVVLLDLSLPDCQGESLIMGVVGLSFRTPVIVLTGYSDIAFGLKSLSMGVSDYLLKDDLTAMSLYKSIIYSAERKRNNAALEESEHKYSKLFHFSPLPMWVIDVNTLKFLDVNHSTISHYGYSLEEFMNMTLKDIRPEQELMKLEEAFQADDQTPGKNTQHVMIHQLKNGELRNVEIQIASINFKGLKANLVIATDITERLNYINAIEAQNKKFKEISWIQSHVIRAPLARIMGLIKLIEADGENGEQADLLKLLALSAEELDEVITNITNKTIVASYKLQEPSERSFLKS